MEELKIYDGRAVFWQWDLDQKLIVPDGLGNEIHFSSSKYDKTPVCDVYEMDGVRLVNVPNIMLQDDLPLTVYAYTVDKKGSRTTYVQAFKVVARPKPDDYVYTETEIRTWADLDERIKALENSGVDPETIKGAVEDYLKENTIQETDPTVPEWAKQPEKPTYTPAEIGAQPAGDYALRNEIPTIPEIPEIPEIPTKLPNPHPLRFTGAVSAEYDGSEAVEVEIPQGGSGGGGIPMPETAKIGQTIVVKAVDENGKPTEWEAADLPSGGGEVWEEISSGKLTEDTTSLSITLDNNGNEFALKKGMLFLKVVGTSANTVDRGQLQFKHNNPGSNGSPVTRGVMTRSGSHVAPLCVAQYDFTGDENLPMGRCFYKSDQDTSVTNASIANQSSLKRLYITGITENAEYMGVGTKWKLIGVRV